MTNQDEVEKLAHELARDIINQAAVRGRERLGNSTTPEDPVRLLSMLSQSVTQRAILLVATIEGPEAAKAVATDHIQSLALYLGQHGISLSATLSIEQPNECKDYQCLKRHLAGLAKSLPVVHLRTIFKCEPCKVRATQMVERQPELRDKFVEIGLVAK